MPTPLRAPRLEPLPRGLRAAADHADDRLAGTERRRACSARRSSRRSPSPRRRSPSRPTPARDRARARASFTPASIASIAAAFTTAARDEEHGDVDLRRADCDRVAHGVEHRHAEHVLPALARRDAADDVRAVVEHEPRARLPLAAGDALHEARAWFRRSESPLQSQKTATTNGHE